MFLEREGVIAKGSKPRPPNPNRPSRPVSVQRDKKGKRGGKGKQGSRSSPRNTRSSGSNSQPIGKKANGESKRSRASLTPEQQRLAKLARASGDDSDSETGSRCGVN